MKLTRQDISSSLVTGFTTGLISWQIFAYLDVTSIVGIPPAALVVIVPVLWIIGVWFGYFLGQWIGFFNQFGRFAAIGFTNAAVDFGVLYILIALTGMVKGPGFSVFKAISFMIAVTHSYFWNRYWTFERKNAAGSREFISFIVVSVIALMINVGVASIVNALPTLVSPAAWAGVAAIAGSATALLLSFVGYRLLVFKR